MKQKYTRKRLDILYDYKDAVIRFGLINLFAALMCFTFILIINNNPYAMKLLPFFSVASIWFISMILLFKESYNKNYLLWVASMLVWVYAITLNQSILDLVIPCVIFSFLYEVIVRFCLGVRIDFKIKEYSWSFEKTDKDTIRSKSE